jgi:hypothetical protein
MSDQQKQNPGTQQDEWRKKQQNQQGGQGGQHSDQQQSGQKYPQSDRDRMDKEQQKKPA